MLCTDFSNPESQRRATACAKMCEVQTTRKTHACSRTATRAVEEKIIVHILFSVLSSDAQFARGVGCCAFILAGVLVAAHFAIMEELAPWETWSSVVLDKRPVDLLVPFTSIRSPAPCGIIMFSALPAWRALTRLFVFLPVESSRSLIVGSAFGRTWHVVFTGTSTGCVSPSPPKYREHRLYNYENRLQVQLRFFLFSVLFGCVGCTRSVLSRGHATHVHQTRPRTTLLSILHAYCEP